MNSSFVPRFLFVAFTVVFAVYAYRVAVGDDIVFGRLVTVLAVSLLIGGLLVFWEWRFQRDFARQLVVILFGIAAGLLATLMLCAVLLLFLVPYNVLQTEEATTLDKAFYIALWQLQFWLPLIISSCLYIGITVVLQTRNDFRFLIPYVDFSQWGTQGGGFLLDTSVLVDGRVAKLCATGVLRGNLVIADYVLRELQSLADSADPVKRERGRRGLDNAHALQGLEGVRVTVRSSAPGAHGDVPVDEHLLADAKELSARVLTTDYNLGKVSRIEGVTVVNLNDVYGALRPPVTVGEQLSLALVRKGQEPGQAVGYLDDGTMVVVEKAADFIGRGALPVTVTGNIQTNAGRMVFARPEGGGRG